MYHLRAPPHEKVQKANTKKVNQEPDKASSPTKSKKKSKRHGIQQGHKKKKKTETPDYS